MNINCCQLKNKIFSHKVGKAMPGSQRLNWVGLFPAFLPNDGVSVVLPKHASPYILWYRLPQECERNHWYIQGKSHYSTRDDDKRLEGCYLKEKSQGCNQFVFIECSYGRKLVRYAIDALANGEEGALLVQVTLQEAWASKKAFTAAWYSRPSRTSLWVPT